jgi:hypothetical protein
MSLVPEKSRNTQATNTPARTEMERSQGNAAGAGRLRSPAEILRIAGSAAAGFVALIPFLHDGILGGDDGKWYTTVVADFIQQWRMGLGPVFVGQTRYAAIGTVIPLRVAPYLQHLTLALDFGTGRRLSPYLLLNLAVVLSGAAAGLSAYLCLRSILPSKRPEALLLAVLYVWCPGVIGLPYTGQLFMSAMAMPFIPIVFVGIVRIFWYDDFSGWAMVSAGCAACWLAHSPIGMWVSLSAALALVVRWLSGSGRNKAEIARATGAGILYLGLCGYVFVSLWFLNPSEIWSTSTGRLLENLHGFFPALLLPVSHIAEKVTDLQLGWSLFFTLATSLALSGKTRTSVVGAVSVVGLVLLCLTLPVPFVTGWLWQSVPQAVVDATNAVPTQRLISVLAACTVTLAAAILGTIPYRRGWVLLGLGIGVAWSGLELRKFIDRGHLITNSKARSEEVLSAENLTPTRYSLGLLSSDNLFFSIGVMDYDLEQRLLDENMGSYLVSNVRTVAPDHDFGRRAIPRQLPGVLKGNSPQDEHIWVHLTPKITLQPGIHYLLAVDVPTPAWLGLFQIKGPRLYREYQLPSSGMAFAFGSGEFSSRVIPLSTDSTVPIELTLEFINQDPNADITQFRNFGRYELIPYNPKSLPIRLKSLAPYVADVRSPGKGWLETFRYFTRGWTAKVNGIPAEVVRSPNGLVAVPVSAGESEVRLTYRPPAALLIAYWGTWATWAALILLTLCRWTQRSFSWADSAEHLTLHSS